MCACYLHTTFLCWSPSGQVQPVLGDMWQGPHIYRTTKLRFTRSFSYARNRKLMRPRNDQKQNFFLLFLFPCMLLSKTETFAEYIWIVSSAKRYLHKGKETFLWLLFWSSINYGRALHVQRQNNQRAFLHGKHAQCSTSGRKTRHLWSQIYALTFHLKRTCSLDSWSRQPFCFQVKGVLPSVATTKPNAVQIEEAETCQVE